MTEPSNLSHAAIREYAERIGKNHQIYDENGQADIDELVVRLGGSVIERDSGESLHIEDKGSFVIFLPTFTSHRRDQFTKAHELGHYFLHYRHAKRAGPASFQRGGRNLAETQSNVFASSLLMPEAAFRRAFAAIGDDFWELADRFGVSPAAAEVRSRVLRLV